MAKEKDEVEALRRKLQDDVKWRNRWAESDKWNLYEQQYRGHFKGEGIIPVNLYFPNVRATMPQVYFRNPSVLLTSNVPGYDIKARLCTYLLQWLIMELDLKEEMKSGGQDTFLCGLGALVHGYDSEYGIPATFLDTEDEYTRTSVSKDEKSLLEYSSNVMPGMPWSRRAHPTDILFGWGTVSRKNIRRFTLRTLRLLDDVKADTKYRKSVTKDLKPSRVQPYLDSTTLDEDAPKGEDWIYIYEVHELRDGQVKVIAGDCNKFLRREDDILSRVLGELPVSPIVWNPNGRSIWGVPDAKILEVRQLEANAISTLASKARRSDIPKTAYQRGEILDEELEKAQSEDVKAFFATEGPPAEVLMELKSRGESGLAMELERVLQRAREELGFSRLRSGALSAPTKRVTGAEVKEVSRGTDIRVYDKQDVLADVLVDVVKKWMKLIFRFWKKPRFIYAPTLQPPFKWILFRGQDLASTYTYKVNPEEAQMETHESRKNELGMIAPFLLQAVQAVPEMNKAELIRQALSRFPGWDLSTILPPDPREAEMAGQIAMLSPEGQLVPLKQVQQGQRALAGAGG